MGRLAELLEADTELASNKGVSNPAPLTGLMTITNIAEMFDISRQEVDKLLAKHQHVKVGRKYRMQIADMPPKYKKVFGSY